jgi:hypothetical protein
MPLAAPVSIPPLLEGDSPTSEEFLRRWEAIPDLKHAELIDGIVYMPSPWVSNTGSAGLSLPAGSTSAHLATPGCRPGAKERG